MISKEKYLSAGKNYKISHFEYDENALSGPQVDVGKTWNVSLIAPLLRFPFFILLLTKLHLSWMLRS